MTTWRLLVRSALLGVLLALAALCVALGLALIGVGAGWIELEVSPRW